MKEWFKKKLLKNCDWIGTFGLLCGIVICFLGVVLAFINPSVGLFTVFAGMIIGVLLAILFSLIRHRYISYRDDYRGDYDRSSYGINLLKVKDERVIESGDRIWGKEGIFPVLLPIIDDGKFSVTTQIVRDLGDEKVVIDISITAFVDESNDKDSFGNYKTQELYDLVVKDGYSSVKDWLADSFTEAVGQAPAVFRAIDENYLNPAALIAAVKTAMKSVNFGLGLSNLKKVEVTIIDNSWSSRTKVVYT